MNDLAETARLIAERARPEVGIMSANRLTRDLGYLAGIVAELADRLSPPSSEAPEPDGIYLIDPPAPGSMERLTHELAEAHARNADLTEQIDHIRGELLESDVWLPSEATSSMVGRLVVRCREEAGRIERALRELGA